MFYKRRYTPRKSHLNYFVLPPPDSYWSPRNLNSPLSNEVKWYHEYIWGHIIMSSFNNCKVCMYSHKSLLTNMREKDGIKLRHLQPCKCNEDAPSHCHILLFKRPINLEPLSIFFPSSQFHPRSCSELNNSLHLPSSEGRKGGHLIASQG